MFFYRGTPACGHGRNELDQCAVGAQGDLRVRRVHDARRERQADLRRVIQHRVVNAG